MISNFSHINYLAVVAAIIKFDIARSLHCTAVHDVQYKGDKQATVG